MSIFKKFPSIKQFRNTVHAVREHANFQGLDSSGEPIYKDAERYPVINFRGTVKIHGTNIGISIDNAGRLTPQNRNCVITEPGTAHGFRNFMDNLPAGLLVDCFTKNVTVFGEWCGEDIHKGTAVNELPKMWVIFAIYDHETLSWVELPDAVHYAPQLNENNIYMITQFDTYEVSIDFNTPMLAQNELVDITTRVEKECPVGKYFGVSGVGEGVVWAPVGEPMSDYAFKVKGPKHSVCRTKNLAPVDIEKVSTVNAFVGMSVTEARLEQGVAEMVTRGYPAEAATTGRFIRWVVGDVLKEEGDAMKASGLLAKDVTKEISHRARTFWFKHLDETLMK